MVDLKKDEQKVSADIKEGEQRVVAEVNVLSSLIKRHPVWSGTIVVIALLLVGFILGKM